MNAMDEDKILEWAITSAMRIAEDKDDTSIKIDAETFVFGQKSIFDSLDIVTMFAELEAFLNDNNHREINLVDYLDEIKDKNIVSIKHLSVFIYDQLLKAV